MPKSLYMNRAITKSKYRRARRSRRQSWYKLPRSITPFGKKMVVPMRYVDRISLNPTLGAVAKHSFSANGLYDPNITGTGHQPMTFDQLVGVFYNHYTVTSSKIRCTFIPDASSSVSRYSAAIIVSSGTSVPTTYEAILENKLNVRYNSGGVMTSGNSKSTIKHRCNLNKFLGQKVMDEDNNAGTSGANPAEQVYFNICTTAFDPSEDGGTVNIEVVIDYVVTLHERINLEES